MSAFLSNPQNFLSTFPKNPITSQMLSLFICGSFKKGEKDQLTISPSSTPTKSRKKNFCKRQYKNTKNPYSSRGLDKFSALVADLEQQRQKIYSQLGSDGMYTVRFAYSNTNEIKPIVTKLKDNEKMHVHSKTNSGILDDKNPTEPPVLEIVKDVKQDGRVSCIKNKKTFSWNNSFKLFSRPDQYYLLIVFIVILLFLAAFGRSAAILCTTIAWYMIPTLQLQESSQMRLSMNMREKSHVRLSMNKRDYVRRLSEKTIACDGLSSQSKSSCTAAVVKDKSS